MSVIIDAGKRQALIWFFFKELSTAHAVRNVRIHLCPLSELMPIAHDFIEIAVRLLGKMAHTIAQDGVDGHAEGVGYVHKILYAY